MSRIFLAGLAILLVATYILVPARSAADKESPSAKERAVIAQKFRKNCMHCHQPPDLRFASDRAWLDQLKRTA